MSEMGLPCSLEDTDRQEHVRQLSTRTIRQPSGGDRLDDGRVGSLVHGMGIDQKSFECHPDTGKQIQGLLSPYWRELKELCLEAAVVLPGFNLQSRDLVICDQGPILQKVQGGGFDVPQVSAQEGMLDNGLRQLPKARNMFWRREIALSHLAATPRRMYRLRHATHKPSKLDHGEGEPRPRG